MNFGLRSKAPSSLYKSVFLAIGFMYGTALQALNCAEIRSLTGAYFKDHFSYNRFDSELSKRTLDNFIRAWDPAKLYFFDDDIKEFEKLYGDKLGSQVQAADCSGIDAISQRYLKRFDERQKKLPEQLKAKQDFNIDESMIIDRKKLSYAKEIKEQDDSWRKRIKFQLLSLKTGASLTEAKAREKIQKRFDLDAKRQAEFTKDKVYEMFLNAFAMALDPHSSYMPPTDLEDFRIKTRLSLEGIGATLKSDDGITIVASLVKGGAAEKGGLLKESDKIVAVAQGNGEPVDVIDLDLTEVVKKIRGARGTTVKLTVLRESASGGSQKIIVPIVREKIQLVDQQASSKVYRVTLSEGGKERDLKIGVLVLPSFYIDFEGRTNGVKGYRSSSEDTIVELKKMEREKIDGLVVDLRSNGGGSLDESVNLAGLFVEAGPIVQIKNQSGKAEAYVSQEPKYRYQGPLLVMINRSSASASEIFAGAIQDYGRGLIVGDSHTFGKGTVQNLINVDPKLGAIKVTVQKFYRASGASTQLQGVSSDIRLPSLGDEYEIGEKFYDYAMPFDSIKGVNHRDFNLVKSYLPKLISLSEKRVQTDKSFSEVNAEIKKFRDKVDERSKLSLKEKKEPAAKTKGGANEKTKTPSPETLEEQGALDLESDIFLQESLYVSADYAQLANKKEPVAMTLPQLRELQMKKSPSPKPEKPRQ